MGLTDLNEFGERTQSIIRELSSERFLAGQLSKFENLLADPDLDGQLHKLSRRAT